MDALARKAEEVAATLTPPFKRYPCGECGGTGEKTHRDPRLAEKPCGACLGRRPAPGKPTAVWQNPDAVAARAIAPTHSDAGLVHEFYGPQLAHEYPTLADAAKRGLPDGWLVLNVEEQSGDICLVTFSDRFGKTKQGRFDRDALRDTGRSADVQGVIEAEMARP